MPAPSRGPEPGVRWRRGKSCQCQVSTGQDRTGRGDQQREPTGRPAALSAHREEAHFQVQATQSPLHRGLHRHWTQVHSSPTGKSSSPATSLPLSPGRMKRSDLKEKKINKSKEEKSPLQSRLQGEEQACCGGIVQGKTLNNHSPGEILRMKDRWERVPHLQKSLALAFSQ